MVEELLRWETPVMGAARIATTDTELDGFAIGEGEHVMVLLGAANVDDSEVPGAETVDFDRESNRHLAFGGASTGVSGRTWPDSSCGSPWRSGIAGSPTTRSSPGWS